MTVTVLQGRPVFPTPRKISPLLEAVAILDCNVIPPFTTARDDGGGIEVIGAVKPQAGHHKAALYELCAAT